MATSERLDDRLYSGYPNQPMRWLRPFIAVLTVYCMIPSSGEIIENVIHLAQHGHGAHAYDDPDHDRHGAEHGCTGTSHVCSCCQSPSFTFVELITGVSNTPVVSQVLPPAVDDLSADGYLSGVFRPPIA